jgi:hypothetical protein
MAYMAGKGRSFKPVGAASARGVCNAINVCIFWIEKLLLLNIIVNTCTGTPSMQYVSISHHGTYAPGNAIKTCLS